MASAWQHLEDLELSIDHLSGGDEYDIPAAPQPKQRSLGQTRQKTRNYEHAVAAGAREHAPDTPLLGPIGIEVLWMSTKKVGDLSNDLKALEDALNRIAYQDDRQIDYCKMGRVYGPQYTDRTLIRVYKL